jgi:hypothetical protein
MLSDIYAKYHIYAAKYHYGQCHYAKCWCAKCRGAPSYHITTLNTGVKSFKV